jgi:hypothetical protein
MVGDVAPKVDFPDPKRQPFGEIYQSNGCSAPRGAFQFGERNGESSIRKCSSS